MVLRVKYGFALAVCFLSLSGFANEGNGKLSTLAKTISARLHSPSLKSAVSDLRYRVAKNEKGCELEGSESGGTTLICDPSVLSMSEEGSARLIGQALANLRYDEIEAKWLEHLGEHEAWVLDSGHAVKISNTQGKLGQTFARELWLSFATREIVAVITQNTQNSVGENRAPASLGSESGGQDSEVRRLLEIQ